VTSAFRRTSWFYTISDSLQLSGCNKLHLFQERNYIPLQSKCFINTRILHYQISRLIGNILPRTSEPDSFGWCFLLTNGCNGTVVSAVAPQHRIRNCGVTSEAFIKRLAKAHFIMLPNRRASYQCNHKIPFHI
jgi:hypothetical protein